jgi:hypothetical protein
MKLRNVLKTDSPFELVTRFRGGKHRRGSTVGSYAPGDANRDGTFNSSDLVQVFQAGE